MQSNISQMLNYRTTKCEHCEKFNSPKQIDCCTNCDNASCCVKYFKCKSCNKRLCADCLYKFLLKKNVTTCEECHDIKLI